MNAVRTHRMIPRTKINRYYRIFFVRDFHENRFHAKKKKRSTYLYLITDVQLLRLIDLQGGGAGSRRRSRRCGVRIEGSLRAGLIRSATLGSSGRQRVSRTAVIRHRARATVRRVLLLVTAGGSEHAGLAARRSLLRPLHVRQTRRGELRLRADEHVVRLLALEGRRTIVLVIRAGSGGRGLILSACRARAAGTAEVIGRATKLGKFGVRGPRRRASRRCSRCGGRRIESAQTELLTLVLMLLGHLLERLGRGTHLRLEIQPGIRNPCRRVLRGTESTRARVGWHSVAVVVTDVVAIDAVVPAVRMLLLLLLRMHRVLVVLDLDLSVIRRREPVVVVVVVATIVVVRSSSGSCGRRRGVIRQRVDALVLEIKVLHKLRMEVRYLGDEILECVRRDNLIAGVVAHKLGKAGKAGAVRRGVLLQRGGALFQIHELVIGLLLAFDQVTDIDATDPTAAASATGNRAATRPGPGTAGAAAVSGLRSGCRGRGRIRTGLRRGGRVQKIALDRRVRQRFHCHVCRDRLRLRVIRRRGREFQLLNDLHLELGETLVPVTATSTAPAAGRRARRVRTVPRLMLAVAVMRPTATTAAWALLMLMLTLRALQLDRRLAEAAVAATSTGRLQILGRPLEVFLLLKQEGGIWS